MITYDVDYVCEKASNAVEWLRSMLFVKLEPSGVVQRHLPIMTSRKLAHMPIGVRPQQAWIETLSSTEDEKLGIIDLHPDIFGLPPRFAGLQIV